MEIGLSESANHMAAHRQGLGHRPHQRGRGRAADVALPAWAALTGKGAASGPGRVPHASHPRGPGGRGRAAGKAARAR